MPLPYQKKQVASLIIQKKREPDSVSANAEPDQGLPSCAQELIDAVHANDAAGVANALRNAMELLEAEEPQEASEVDGDQS